MELISYRKILSCIQNRIRYCYGDILGSRHYAGVVKVEVRGVLAIPSQQYLVTSRS
jgi:hypothetical protein